jgi:hypothetical protein
MEPHHKKEVEKIIGEVECLEDFKCYESGFNFVCKAKDVGTKKPLLLCFQKGPLKCAFVNVSAGFICECPLRAYIARHLKK